MQELHYLNFSTESISMNLKKIKCFLLLKLTEKDREFHILCPHFYDSSSENQTEQRLQKNRHKDGGNHIRRAHLGGAEHIRADKAYHKRARH